MEPRESSEPPGDTDFATHQGIRGKASRMDSRIQDLESAVHIC